MHAVRFHTTGSPDVMVLEDAPRPGVADDEILIEVRAAGINPVDTKTRLGVVETHGPMPVVPGREVSGIVVETGRAVRACSIGDEVFALLHRHGGGYAELATAAAGEWAAKPETLDHIHAAAVPLAALTAWQGLFDHGGLRRGQTVLVHGAGGGVGHFAIQLARHAGARVVGTAPSADLDLVSRLGADIVIDYGAMPFQRVVTDVDVVLDLVAGPTQVRSWSVLRPGGRLVSSLGPPERSEDAPPEATGTGFLVRPDAEQLAGIARLIDDGRLRVVVSRILPLAEARRAHTLLEERHSQGKSVLRVR